VESRGAWLPVNDLDTGLVWPRSDYGVSITLAIAL
jgi:hypothetical protein